MSQMMGLSGLQVIPLLLLLAIQRSVTTDTKKPVLSWIRPGILTHQSLHSVLVSMEERLRGLENMKYTTNKLDLYLETVTKQLDSLDVRTRAVQIKLEQLETVAQNLMSHELKNDLSTVHLQRIFETNQVRLVHKISLTENRLDSSIIKMQGTMDLGFEKVEKRQSEFENKLNNMHSLLEGVSERLTKIEGRTNTTTQAIQLGKIADLEDRRTHMNKITDMLMGIEKHVNKSILFMDQNDSPRNQPKENDKIKDIIKAEFHTEANKIGNKINNMYNDLWSKTMSIENILKEVANLSTCTRGRSEESSESSTDDIRCSETIASVTRETVGTLGIILQEKLERMDTNLDGVFATYKMLLGAYNKMREDEHQFEAKLTFVLGKILDTIENKTKSADEIQKKTLETLKSHNNQVVRTVAYNTNSLRKLAEDSGIEHKNLDSSLSHLINFLTPEKHESQEYEDNMNEPFEKGRKSEDKEMKVDESMGLRLLENASKVETEDVVSLNGTYPSNTSTDLIEKDEHIHMFGSHAFNEENMTNEFDSKAITEQGLDDENDKAVTRLLMLYLKTLKGHLSKDKFLYEANPSAPYSSVQQMIKKLKEKNFPLDFLKELEEWDNETNEKEVMEDINDVKEFTDNPNEDYLDKDYVD